MIEGFVTVQDIRADTGDVIKAAGLGWHCIVPCTVVGFEASSKQLMIQGGPDGYMQNDGHFILDCMMHTKAEPGQSPTAARCLGPYKQVEVHSGDGFNVETIIQSEITPCGIILISEDKEYLKVASTRKGGLLVSPKLTMGDLLRFRLIHQATFDQYEAEEKFLREERLEKEVRSTFRELCESLGPKVVLDVLKNFPVDKKAEPENFAPDLRPCYGRPANPL